MDPTARHLSEYRSELYRLFPPTDNESANESKSSDETFFGTKQISPRPILANSKRYIPDIPAGCIDLPYTPPNIPYTRNEMPTPSCARKIQPQKQENIWQDRMFNESDESKFDIWPSFTSSPIPLSPPTLESYFQSPNFNPSFPNVSQENIENHTLSPTSSTLTYFYPRQPLYNKGNRNVPHFASQNYLSEAVNINNNININSNGVCTFCKKNGETPQVYSSHALRGRVGGKSVVSCPVLRSHICETCGETGDNAHTITYCPVWRSVNHGMPLPSTAITLKSSRLKSNGKRRY